MSLPLPAPALMPDTAPFSAEDIRTLNAVLTGASSVQRAWLSGFLAGVDAAAGDAAPTAMALAPPAAKTPLTILFGTESGNAEGLAADAKKAAGRLNFAASVLDMGSVTPQALQKAKNLIVIASTWGEGEPPQRATEFYDALMADTAPRLEGLRFAVLALGDRAYAQYCAVGHAIDTRLAALGATRAADLVECDLDYAAPAAGFIATALKAYAPERADATVISLDTRRAPAATVPDKAAPYLAEITEHLNLHSSRSTADTVHIELSLAGSGIVYEPGDALAVLPRNDPRTVAAILSAIGRGSDAELADSLASSRDITTLTRPLLSGYAAITGDIALQAIAGDPGDAANWIAGKQPIDLFEAAPQTLSRDQVLSLLRPLPPRYYSIASSQKSVGEQADLLVARLSWKHGDELRQGVASNDLIAQRRVGDTVLAELPRGQRGALVARPRLVDPDMQVDTGLVCLVDRGQRGAPVHRREPAGVAMG